MKTMWEWNNSNVKERKSMQENKKAFRMKTNDVFHLHFTHNKRVWIYDWNDNAMASSLQSHTFKITKLSQRWATTFMAKLYGNSNLIKSKCILSECRFYEWLDLYFIRQKKPRISTKTLYISRFGASLWTNHKLIKRHIFSFWTFQIGRYLRNWKQL